jgi:molybdopterin converting factor small subunit
LLFGHYHDIVDDIGGESGALAVALPGGASVGDLARAVSIRDPRLSDLPERVRAAIGDSFVAFDRALSDGDEVAFLPPMSGG